MYFLHFQDSAIENTEGVCLLNAVRVRDTTAADLLEVVKYTSLVIQKDAVIPQT